MLTIDQHFIIGDIVQVAEDAWTHSAKVLDGFGFKKDAQYEVSGVYKDGIISLKGATASYYPSYFELAKAGKQVYVEKEKPVGSVSALDKQISGNHYKDCGIQPIEYIHANGLSYLEGNVIKYTTRHSKKNGKQDILKAIHYLELILEMDYKDDTI